MPGDINVTEFGNSDGYRVLRYQTEAGEADIKLGQPVKLKSAGSRYVIPAADGDFVIGTSTAFVGVAKTDSSHTATEDGEISVYIHNPRNVYIADAKDASLVDTDAKIKALQNKRVVLDLTSDKYTVDTAESDGATNSLVILGGDPVHGKVTFFVRASAGLLN